MILPTKRIGPDRALIAIGAEVLSLLQPESSVSRLWADFKRLPVAQRTVVTYDWFVLALDLLYMMNVIEYENGTIRRANT